MSKAKHRGGELTSKEQAMASAVLVQSAIHESESRKGAQIRSSCPPPLLLGKKGSWKERDWRDSGWRPCRPLGSRLATVSKRWSATDHELVNKQTYLLTPLRNTTGRKDGNVSIFDSQKLLLSPLEDTIDAGRKSHCVRVEKTSEKG